MEAELKELAQQHDAIQASAERLTNGFLVSGFFVLSFQLVAFIYLTW